MRERALERLLWFGSGFAVALLGIWATSGERDPGPSEREARIARDLRIAKEVERDHARLRLEEAERRRMAEARRSMRARRAGESPRRRARFATMRPADRDEMVGAYTDDETNTIWIELHGDGRYVYEGIPGEFLEGARPTDRTRVVLRGGRMVVEPTRERVPPPGYAQRHTGTWTFEDDVLVMEPYDPMHNAHVTFTWDAAEAAIRVRFLGVAPSHITQVLLRHIAEDG